MHLQIQRPLTLNPGFTFVSPEEILLKNRNQGSILQDSDRTGMGEATVLIGAHDSKHNWVKSLIQTVVSLISFLPFFHN